MSAHPITPLSVPYRRGSIWRKWDLHVHAPDTVFNNQFPHTDGQPDWETYLSAVEALKDIAVLGVTDYFSIDGYKKLLEFKLQGRMSNIALLLPNIEFRLDLLIPTSSSDDAAKVKKVNAHVIFSRRGFRSRHRRQVSPPAAFFRPRGCTKYKRTLCAQPVSARTTRSTTESATGNLFGN